ncbi:MAG: helix-turn-helix domain-containing protein [Oscillospiraceae bacterium]
MDYISVKEAAERWSISDRRVHQYCEDGRIPGLLRFGRAWMIPAATEKPADPRCLKKRGGDDNDAR